MADDEDYATLEIALSLPECENCGAKMRPAFREWKCPLCTATKPYA